MLDESTFEDSTPPNAAFVVGIITLFVSIKLFGDKKRRYINSLERIEKMMMKGMAKRRRSVSSE